jgi:uncharacterized protein (DUF1778 family)
VIVMTAKTRRIEMRADVTTDRLITQAAQALGESISSFVLRAARDEASRVLSRPHVTPMSADQFDELIMSLDVPDDTSSLRRATERPRHYHEMR